MRKLPFLVAMALLLPYGRVAVAQDGAGGPKIIDGTLAQDGQFPWQMFVQIDLATGNSVSCGGSLLSASVVLTAAHCLDHDVQIQSVSVGAGSTRVSQQTMTVRQVDRSLVHEGFNNQPNAPNFSNDIALLFLAQPYTLTSRIAPVTLVRSGLESLWATGATARVSGWGRTRVNDSQSASADLLYVDVPIVSDAACRSAWVGIMPAFDGTKHVCTEVAQMSTGPCHGDSGGPLSVFDSASQKWHQVGIVSFGNQDCPPGRPAAYTEVASYLSWISQNTGTTPPAQITFSADSRCGERFALPALRSEPVLTVNTTASGPSGETVTLQAGQLPAWTTFAQTPGNPARGRLDLSPGFFDWLFNLFAADTPIRISASSASAQGRCDYAFVLTLF